jgi:uncharacterized membrane protein YgcG
MLNDGLISEMRVWSMGESYNSDGVLLLVHIAPRLAR